MALILDFNAHATKASRGSSRARAAGSAEIVIFPGVRYERWDDANARPKRRTKQRDRIELPD
jgi:hypothetical protein